MLTDLEKTPSATITKTSAKNLPGFRPRASQREMIAAIANAFSRTLRREEGEEAPKREGESIAVIEGPTGVGKSLAYLLAGGIMAQTARQAADCEQRDGCLAGAVGGPRSAVSG